MLRQQNKQSKIIPTQWSGGMLSWGSSCNQQKLHSLFCFRLCGSNFALRLGSLKTSLSRRATVLPKIQCPRHPRPCNFDGYSKTTILHYIAFISSILHASRPLSHQVHSISVRLIPIMPHHQFYLYPIVVRPSLHEVSQSSPDSLRPVSHTRFLRGKGGKRKTPNRSTRLPR